MASGLVSGSASRLGNIARGYDIKCEVRNVVHWITRILRSVHSAHF